MGRARTALTAEQIDQALAYLKRALDRKADLFSAGMKETKRSLATLRRRRLTLPWPAFLADANTWLDTHLTSEGRRTTLAALRRREADERMKADEEAEGAARAVRVSAQASRDVTELSLLLAVSRSSVVGLMARAALEDNRILTLLKQRCTSSTAPSPPSTTT